MHYGSPQNNNKRNYIMEVKLSLDLPNFTTFLSFLFVGYIMKVGHGGTHQKPHPSLQKKSQNLPSFPPFLLLCEELWQNPMPQLFHISLFKWSAFQKPLPQLNWIEFHICFIYICAYVSIYIFFKVFITPLMELLILPISFSAFFS